MNGNATCPEPPVGSFIRDRDDNLHEHTAAGWMDSVGTAKTRKASRTFIGSWDEFLRWYGPVAVIPEAGDLK